MEIIDSIYKEVNFKKYCPICKHAAKAGVEYPCDECLESGMNEKTEKPVNFKEKDN